MRWRRGESGSRKREDEADHSLSGQGFGISGAGRYFGNRRACVACS